MTWLSELDASFGGDADTCPSGCNFMDLSYYDKEMP